MLHHPDFPNVLMLPNEVFSISFRTGPHAGETRQYNYHILATLAEQAHLTPNCNVPVALVYEGQEVENAVRSHERAMSDEIDLAVPLLGFVQPDDWDAVPDGLTRVVIVDGMHRVYKAFHLSVSTLPAIIFPADVEPVIRIDIDEIVADLLGVHKDEKNPIE
jgi:hypothetical protein